MTNNAERSYQVFITSWLRFGLTWDNDLHEHDKVLTVYLQSTASGVSYHQYSWLWKRRVTNIYLTEGLQGNSTFADTTKLTVNLLGEIE